MSKVLFKAFIIGACFVSALCFFLSLSEAQEVWPNLGLYGGQIYEIAIDPVNPDKMFTGTNQGGGLFLTEDGGATWKPVLTGEEGGYLDGVATFRNTAVFAVKLAPNNHNIIWVAHNYWLEKSTNGGATWTHISNDTIQQNCTNCGGVDDDFRHCESLAIDPTDPNIVYVGTGGPDGSDSKGAIYKTTNGGGSWTKLGMIGPFTAGGYNVTLDHEFYSTVGDIAIHPSDSNILWALDFNDVLGDYRGFLYLSIDGGQTWDWDVGVPSNIAEQGLVVKPDEPNVVFIGCFGRNDAVEQFGGIFRVEYPKDGETVLWEIKPSWSSPLPAGANNVRAVAFDPQNDSILYAASGLTGGFKLLKSLDGGDTFKEYVHDQQFISLTPHPTNSDIIFGGDRTMGVYKGELIAVMFDNDKTDYDWTPSKDGIHAIRVNDLAVDPNKSDHLLAATMGGVYEKQGAGAWTPTARLRYNEAFSVAFDPSDTTGSTYYAGIESYLSKTTNNGTSWTRSNSLGYPHYVNSIAVNPNDATNLYVTTRYPGGVYKSNDSGSTLTSVMKFSAVLDSDVSNGTLNLNDNGSFTYEHDNSDTTTDTFTYHINDGVTNSGTATVTINITGTATSPLAVNDTYTVEKGGSLTRTIPPGVLNNDVGSNLEAVLDSDISHGTLSLYKDGSFSYIHDNSDTTADTFTYHVIEGEVESNIATVTIHIAPTINPPVAINDSYTVEKGGALTVTYSKKWFPIGVLHNDVQTNNFDFNTVAIDPDPQTPDHVFVGGGNYFGAKVLGKIYETTNGGSTWSVALDGVIVNSLLIDPDDPNIIYSGCGYSGGTDVPLYKSTDGGQTWIPFYKDMPGAPSRNAIWGSSASDIFVLGYTGSVVQGGSSANRVLQFDGNTWEFTGMGVSNRLKDLWGLSPSDIYAVGEGGIIVHFDGSQWTEMVSGTTEELLGIWGASANYIFAVGRSGTILHYDGSRWLPMESKTTRDLSAVWGTDDHANVYAVGAQGTILKYDQIAWSAMESGVEARLEGVWSTPLGSHIFAVGNSRWNGDHYEFTILHYDSNTERWITMKNLPPTGCPKLWGVWGSSWNDVYAVGEAGVILHFNGINWSETAAGISLPLYAVWGTSSNNVYAAGQYGTMLAKGTSGWRTVGDSAKEVVPWNAVTDLELKKEADRSFIYASTSRQGIYVSDNQLGIWGSLLAPPYEVFALAVGSANVATNGGAFKAGSLGVLTGSVKDEANLKPVDQVKISTDFGISDTTDADGEYSMRLSAGYHNLTTWHDNYATEKVNVPIHGSGSCTFAHFSLMTADVDGDGISDAVENASSCLDANDADTDDDGITDGEEDTDKNGKKNSGETDPCRLDTDNDGIQDGTELGLTLNDIGSDTDTAIFQPDLDPTTKTNPLDNDSDNDGLLDGKEDLNRNGRVDAGETDPSSLKARALSAILPLLLGD